MKGLMSGRASAAVALLSAVATLTAAPFPKFQAHTLAHWGMRMGQTALVDIDRDGDLDWVVGQSGNVSWFEYRGAEDWVRHPVGQGARTDVGGTAFDIDADGWVDVVAGTAWYRNPQTPRTKPFTRYDNGAISCHDNVAADVNGDGKLDVLACSNDRRHVRVAWYEIPADPRRPWREHVIGPGIHAGIEPRGTGDLDGDGDTDVVRGDVWFENQDGRGLQWKEHRDLIPPEGSRAGRFGLALKSWVIDLDHDGDLDVVEAEADCEDGRVLWFENLGRARRWSCHLISSEHTGQDFHSLAVADFDNDGDADVFSGGGPLTSKPPRQWFIWENADGRGGRWIEHVVLSGKRCHEAKAADVDGDGDIDICSKPWNGDEHICLRNLLK